MSAELISPEQRWCSGKLSACLPWYTFCQVSIIFSPKFRRKKSRWQNYFQHFNLFRLASKKSLLLWSVIRYPPCSEQEQTLFNFSDYYYFFFLIQCCLFDGSVFLFVYLFIYLFISNIVVSIMLSPLFLFTFNLFSGFPSFMVNQNSVYLLVLK